MRKNLKKKLSGYVERERRQACLVGEEEITSRFKDRSIGIKGEESSTQRNTRSESSSSRLKIEQAYEPLKRAPTSPASFKAVVHQSKGFAQAIKSCRPESSPAYQEDIQLQDYGVRVKVTVIQQDSPARLISSSKRAHHDNSKHSLSKVQKEQRDENRDAVLQNDIHQGYDLMVGPSGSTFAVEPSPCLHSELHFLSPFISVDDHSQIIGGTKKENGIDDKAESEKESNNRLEDWLDRIYHEAPAAFAKTHSDLNFMSTLPLSMLDDASDYFFADSEGNSKQNGEETSSMPRTKRAENNDEANPVEYMVASISRWASIPRNVDETADKLNHAVVLVSPRNHKSSLEQIQTSIDGKCDLPLESYAETVPELEERTHKTPRSNMASLTFSELTECAGCLIDGPALTTEEEKHKIKLKQTCGLSGKSSTGEHILANLALAKRHCADSRDHNSEPGNTTSPQRTLNEGRNEGAISRSNTDLCLRDEPDEHQSVEYSSISERKCDTRQKESPPVKHPFPSNQKREQPYVHAGPHLSFKEIHPRNLTMRRREANSKRRQKPKWFSARQIQRSLPGRRRKEEKNPVGDIAEYGAATPQGLTPTPSIHTQEKRKSVRFDKELTKVHMIEPTEDFEDDESQSLFNYYYDLFTSKEGEWSVEEEEDSYADSKDDSYTDSRDDSYADSSIEDENQCFIEFVGVPPLVCHESFALEENGAPEDLEDDGTPDEEDSIFQ